MLKTMIRYKQLKRFHHNRLFQFYMYDFMYVDPETIYQEDYFLATRTFVESYKKRLTIGPDKKHWLGFSYMFSEEYELDLNFGGTGIKKRG